MRGNEWLTRFYPIGRAAQPRKNERRIKTDQDCVRLVGGVLVALAIVVFVVNLAVSLARTPEGEVIDPWEGHTLEWTADASAITVASPSPLFDAREGGA